MAQYGQGSYGQANPYAQGGGNRYNQDAGNPYAQQAGNPYGQPAAAQTAYGGGRPQQSGYGNGNAYGQATGTTGYGGNDMEMQPINGQAGAYGQAGGRDPNAILNECRDIDRGIDAIERNLERLRFLQQRALDDPDASQNTQTNRELDALGSETMTLYRNFGARIKNIKSQRESGDARNAPQVGKVDRKLKATINEYQQLESSFRQKLSAQMERQYRIVRPDASEQEVQDAIADTSNQQVFSQALLQGNRRGESQSALRAVQGRHEAIQKIEQQMIELAQLFQDVDAAIVQQEPAIVDIEQKAEGTHENIGQANTQLDGAIAKARSRNRKKWICLFLCLLLIIIIVVVVIIVVKVVIPNQKKP